MAERANRTIVEMVRCLILQVKLPKTDWLRAIETAFYLRNRVNTNKESESPKLENLKKF